MAGSAEFWAEAFGGGKVKTPSSTWWPRSAPSRGRSRTRRGVARQLNNMGMGLYASVPPTGYSNRGSEWLNPSSHSRA